MRGGTPFTWLTLLAWEGRACTLTGAHVDDDVDDGVDDGVMWKRWRNNCGGLTENRKMNGMRRKKEMKGEGKKGKKKTSSEAGKEFVGKTVLPEVSASPVQDTFAAI